MFLNDAKMIFTIWSSIRRRDADAAREIDGKYDHEVRGGMSTSRVVGGFGGGKTGS